MRQKHIAVLAIALSGLIAPALAAADTLSGTVTYLQRIAMPPDAVLTVEVQDVSRADAPAEVIAHQTIASPGNPPYAFAFDFDPETIDPAHSYSMRATMHQDGKLLMTTDQAYPVLTRGAGDSVEMVMKMVSESDQAAKPDSPMVNTYWKLLTLKGEAVPVAKEGREAHLILRNDGNFSATVGCNQINGGYDITGADLGFTPGPMTMMACIPPFDRFEQDLVETLGTAAGFGISGESMELLDPAGGTLATFRAVYF
ncbi:YbaY family lipoprotein [Tropicimonas sp. TH_r6]|uniref:YbaY family lipoprotein n=1 Tax=Tropicimonas sp. TH_r6 TaxID=3082085 RepID=UPI002955DF37|nr:YbaY family lipoprotein [Tropicimonas sp. TH_r6]MDV7142806.1 YbaY family lipoprotein [Tropicimonas sp. TH_r6]